jgi:hypothetical protein
MLTLLYRLTAVILYLTFFTAIYVMLYLVTDPYLERVILAPFLLGTAMQMLTYFLFEVERR